MKIKLKNADNLIPYSEGCMGFSNAYRIKLNSGKTIDINEIPKKGINYVVKTTAKKGTKK